MKPCIPQIKEYRLSGITGRAHKAGRVARRNMNDDVTDGVLVDLREVNLDDLNLTDRESALFKALNRLLMSNVGCNFNSFGSSIS
jgi:hypothetical protein